jgi:V-type H+-transporting ATPase subunit H
MEGPSGDFYVKKLVKLVASHDEQIAAIACFGLGKFVPHYPNGRMVAKRLGAKDLVTHMIEHENAELRRHALQCVSKMLMQNWKYVSTS